MKKLLLLLSVFLVATAFTCNNKPTPTESSAKASAAAVTPTIALLSLNGIPRIDARAMADDFAARKKNDLNPTPQAVFFSAEMIHNLVLLLDEEIKGQLALEPGRTDITDGVRIYFASDPTQAGYPLKTSVVLVSTKDHGFCRNRECRIAKERLHDDYYDHDKNAALFTSNGIAGTGCNLGEKCPGTALYNISGVNDPANCVSIPHYVKRDVAERMVRSFHRRKGAVSDSLNTEAVWFDLALFKAIDSVGTADKIDGIRIYFARNEAVGTAHPNRDTFIIATVKKDTATGNLNDYFDCKFASLYKELMNKKVSLKSGMPPLDKGELCPDNCRP